MAQCRTLKENTKKTLWGMGFNVYGKYFETKYFEEVFCKYFLRKKKYLKYQNTKYCYTSI